MACRRVVRLNIKAGPGESELPIITDRSLAWKYWISLSTEWRRSREILSFLSFSKIISLRPFRAEKHPKKKFDRAKGLEKGREKEICVDRRERLSDEILSTRRSLLVLIDSKDEFHICRATFIVVPVLDSRISPPRLASALERAVC